MTEFVFVHGSWHRSSCWERVTPILLDAGHHVSMVDLPSGDPSATMEDYVESVQSAITSPRDTVLVAHSSAGLVGSVVAERLRLRELVLLAAFLPWPGMSVLEEASKCRILQDDWAPVYARLPRDGEGGTSLSVEVAAQFFYNDCQPQDVQAAMPGLAVERATLPFSQPTPFHGIRSTPSRYIACTRDRTIRPEWSRGEAPKRCDRFFEIDSGHSPFWSIPRQLVRSLIEGLP
jgi:pimeloyl-ACP methyl ester carboxylesterase